MFLGSVIMFLRCTYFFISALISTVVAMINLKISSHLNIFNQLDVIRTVELLIQKNTKYKTGTTLVFDTYMLVCLYFVTVDFKTNFRT